MSANNAENDNSGASYPYVPLSTALSVAEAVKQLGGGKAAVPKSQLAAAMKEDEKSQVFTFKIAGARCFGLIEGKSSFSLTENAKRYFFPTSNTDKIEASLAFLQSPYSFAEIIKRFDGGTLPEQPMMANIFHTQLRVPESWSVRAAQFFTRSAQLVGAIDEKGYLRFDASKHNIRKDAALQAPTETHADSKPGVDDMFETTGYHVYVLPLPNNRQVNIKAPLDITASEIKRLQKWIEFTLQVDWSEDNAK